ncbi:hypothetical protein MKX08_003447 [Trichoderma sp. CBMAI-0020]|nr:hypothetical protein MKX08_003447 [Trichoderma sp. CBMAI-0020]
MPAAAPFCVYVHGCPGFHNVEICKELSTLLNGSEVLRMGHNVPRGLRFLWTPGQAQMEMRRLLTDAVSDVHQAKQHSWIFADFRGTPRALGSDLPVREYENAADSLGQPFVHVILRCHSPRLNGYNRLGRSVPITDAHEFTVFESTWNAEGIRASGKANELEVDIGDLGPKEVAKMIFEGISKIRHL